MRRIIIFLFALFSFTVLSANCAAPIGLVLENTVEVPQEVHLTYLYDTASSSNEGIDDTVAYRARKKGDGWTDIAKIAINGIFTMDIGTDPCVPPGEWTYVIPFSCNKASCGCWNYEDITIPEHGANCIDTAEPTTLTSAEFEAKQRDESWYESPDYSSHDEATVVADDTGMPDDEPVTDDDIGGDQNDEATVPVNDPSAVTDTDTTNSVEKKESSGCSLVIL